MLNIILGYAKRSILNRWVIYLTNTLPVNASLEKEALINFILISLKIKTILINIVFINYYILNL